MYYPPLTVVSWSALFPCMVKLWLQKWQEESRALFSVYVCNMFVVCACVCEWMEMCIDTAHISHLHVGVREQIWWSVLAFRLVWDRVFGCLLLHCVQQASWPPVVFQGHKLRSSGLHGMCFLNWIIFPASPLLLRILTLSGENCHSNTQVPFPNTYRWVVVVVVK